MDEFRNDGIRLSVFRLMGIPMGQSAFRPAFGTDSAYISAK